VKARLVIAALVLTIRGGPYIMAYIRPHIRLCFRYHRHHHHRGFTLRRYT